jgi:hypothetical protein
MHPIAITAYDFNSISRFNKQLKHKFIIYDEK